MEANNIHTNGRTAFAFVIENTWLTRAFSDHGWGNGYVALPKDHFLFGMGYDEIHEQFDIHVNGGLTFAQLLKKENVTNPTAWPDAAIGMWVIGFDTAHWSDTLEIWPKEAVEREAQYLLEQINKLIPSTPVQESDLKERLDRATELLTRVAQEYDEHEDYLNIMVVNEIKSFLEKQST